MARHYLDPGLSPNERADAAVEAIRLGLLARGMRPDAADQLARGARHRVLVSGEGGTVRFAYARGIPGYYPAAAEPLRCIVADIYDGASALDRGATTQAEIDDLARRKGAEPGGTFTPTVSTVRTNLF